MKKQNITGIIVYFVILALAVVFGLLVIREYYSKSGMETGTYVLYTAGAIVVGLIFHSILFELAHMLGAKIGRYNIKSVCILGLTWEKKDDKTHFHFSSFDGLTGETKIVPKQNVKKQPNPIHYLIMGTIFFFIEVVVVVFLFSYLTRVGSSQLSKNIGYFLIIVMAIGAMLLIYNIIPLQLDSVTDGYRLRLISGKKNKDTFNAMLLGKTPEEHAKDERIVTAFSSDIKMNQLYVLLQEEKYKEAEEVADVILKQAETAKISEKTYNAVKTQKVFLVIFNNDLEVAREYLDKNMPLHEKKQLSEGDTLLDLRAYVLMSGLVDRSRWECDRSLKKAYKAYKRTPVERRELESKLFNLGLQKVVDKYPEWNFQDYKINA